jgi:hypothetical protein
VNLAALAAYSEGKAKRAPASAAFRQASAIEAAVPVQMESLVVAMAWWTTSLKNDRAPPWFPFALCASAASGAMLDGVTSCTQHDGIGCGLLH